MYIRGIYSVYKDTPSTKRDSNGDNIRNSKINIRGRQGAGDRGLGVYRDERPPWLADPRPLLRLLSSPSSTMFEIFK